jgi:HPt (histidine-containing phosphotransfer) domain-containing protein
MSAAAATSSHALLLEQLQGSDHMGSNKEPVKDHRSGRCRQAMDAVLQFFLRALTPVNRPLAAVPEVPPLPEDDQLLKGRKQSFSGEMFAELLLELPMHRRRLTQACESGDIDTLGNAVHQLLGAVAYCDAPELEEALRELRLAIKTGEQHTIKVYHERAINVIDSTLRYSGYRGHV